MAQLRKHVFASCNIALKSKDDKDMDDLGLLIREAHTSKQALKITLEVRPLRVDTQLFPDRKVYLGECMGKMLSIELGEDDPVDGEK